MRTIIATLKSITPMYQSKYIDPTLKEEKELHADFENRIWKERCHSTPEGFVFIPPAVFKNCIAEAAKFLSIQIPGKGKATYTKHFEAGIMVAEGVTLNTKKVDVKMDSWMVPSDGRRGGSKRVAKCFPMIKEWGGDVTFYVLDDTITKEVFDHHLSEAGKFIGIGAFRPRNNGWSGRFDVLKTVEVK